MIRYLRSHRLTAAFNRKASHRLSDLHIVRVLSDSTASVSSAYVRSDYVQRPAFDSANLSYAYPFASLDNGFATATAIRIATSFRGFYRIISPHTADLGQNAFILLAFCLDVDRYFVSAIMRQNSVVSILLLVLAATLTSGLPFLRAESAFIGRKQANSALTMYIHSCAYARTSAVLGTSRGWIVTRRNM